MSMNSRASRNSGWQPIGLATPQVPNGTPHALVHDLSVARARRTARALIAPGVVIAATLGVVSTAAATGGMIQTSTGDAPVMTTQSDTHTVPVTTTQSDADLAATSGPATTTSAGGSGGLPIGDSLPGGTLPIVGGFVSHAPGIFTGGLFGGKTVQTSASNGSTTAEGGHEAGHSKGGDACDFFLEHMWKNEDGIPVIGTNTHFLTFHTDPDYKNLPLSLASGSIGNSQMPIIDAYGGPLGWIPIFNPSHVRGHGTDYATMLTGCGGMGLPINTKTMSVDLEKLPTPEKVLGFAQKVIPTVPSPEKVLAPDYLYNTLRVDEITNRIGPDVIFTPEEYLAFAGKNFDAFRLLWQTALEKFGSGNPTAVLDALKITDNIKTLQSLGLPGLPGSGDKTLTNSLPSGGLTKGLPTGDLASKLPTSSVPLVGPLFGDLLGGSTPTPGSTTPGSTTPGSTTPGSTTPGSTTPGSNPLGGLLGGGIPVLGGVLGGSTPSGSTPSGSTPSGSTPSGTSPSGTTEPAPASPKSPLGNLPVVGDLLGGSLPLGGVTGSKPSGSTPSGSTPSGSTPSGSTPSGTSGTTAPAPASPKSPVGKLPVVGDLLGGSSSPLGSLTSALPTGGLTSSLPLLGSKPAEAPAPGSTTPGSTTPGSTTPGSTTPGSTTPGSTTPGSTTPGSTMPGSTTPGSTTPGSTTPGSTTPGSTTPGSTTPGSTTPGSTTPGSTTPGSTTPGSTTPGSTTPGSTTPGSTTPGSTTPGSTTPGSTTPGSTTPGSTTPGSTTPGSTTPGSTTPGSTTPGSTTPGSTTPGSTTPGSTTPGSTTPGSTTPGSTTPGSTTPGSAPIDSPQGTVAFKIGSPKVNGTPSLNAPGAMVPAGNQVTFTVPVTNTGDVPITTLAGKASDGGTMTGAQLPLAPGATTTLTYTTTAKPGTQSTSFGVVGSNPNGQQQGKSCSAVYTGDVKNGEVATTNQFRVNNQPTSGDATYTFTSTDPSAISVQVTNRGTAPLTNVTGSSPAGAVTGGKTSLAPGESTWFTIPVQPKSGVTTVPFNFTGTDATGKKTTSTESFKYTLCTCGASA
jgi:hypothetical protein